MKYKKFSVLATVFAMILVVGLAAAFTTSAKASANANGSGTTEVPGAPVDYAVYETYGLIYDEQNGYYTYDGKIVRHFNDPANGAGFTNFYSGTVDLEAERDAAGSLTGIRECSKELYDLHTQKQNHLAGSPAAGGTVQTGSVQNSWLNEYDYAQFGIEYNEQENGWYFANSRIKKLTDEGLDRVYWTDEDGITLELVRDEQGQIQYLFLPGPGVNLRVFDDNLATLNAEQESFTEVPCVHGWEYGTDLMQDDTLIGCHGFEEEKGEGYNAIYYYAPGVVPPGVEEPPHQTLDDAEEYTGDESELCECGAVRPISVAWTDRWREYDAVPCPDDPEGTDTIQRMYGILTSECPSCGYFKSPFVYKTRTVCGETDGYWLA